MSSRSRIRPRTKVYDSIYSIGESYYRPALDRLDRKYSGRPTSPVKQSSLPRELAERHAEAFVDDDLPSARRRAEKLINEDNVFDAVSSRSIGVRPVSAVLEGEDDVTSSLQKIQARRRLLATKMVDDVDMENTFNNLSAHRMVSRTEKLLDSVGLNESSARKMFDESSSTVSRRALKMTTENDSNSMAKWTALTDTDDSSSAAAIRARKSRARLNDLQEEMDDMAERQAVRERRVANLRALMAENAEESEALQMRTARVTSRTEKKTVTF